MRNLFRNKRPFHYCLFNGKVYMTDDRGYLTGESAITYSQPTMMKGCISSARGSMETEQFGTNFDYDRVLIVDDPKCPIDETTVLFIDKSPEFDIEGRPLYDYIVKKVARTFSHVSYAIVKVRPDDNNTY